jgi:hypothetical protein
VLPVPTMQLDIFDHSRDVVLRNDVLDALQRRDAASAGVAWCCLADEFPGDGALAALTLLIESLEGTQPPAIQAPFADHAAAAAARVHLESRVEPAACRLYGDAQGLAWATPLWAVLAARSASLAFDADHPDDHAAASWLRAGDVDAAATAVCGITSWRRIPVPLGWMAEARYRQRPTQDPGPGPGTGPGPGPATRAAQGQAGATGLDASWPLLVELAWLAPRRLDLIARRLADPLLDRLRKRFDAEFEGAGDGSDLAWFPAWLLTEKPALAATFGLAQASLHSTPEVAMRLLIELIGLERQGRHHDVVERRKTLRDLHAGLYAAYMKTR